MESAQITACCDALTLSLGTPNVRRLKGMYQSAARAGEKGIPVVLDPVGVTASPARLEAANRLISSGVVCVIRGNVSEIRVLAGENDNTHSLEAADTVLDARAAARRLAKLTGAIVVMTGKTDVVTDGILLCTVDNGHEILRSVTGAGCQLTALLGAFAAANPERLFEACAAAVCMMGMCGEIAQRRMGSMEGNAACRGFIIDAAYRMTQNMLEEGANYALESG